MRSTSNLREGSNPIFIPYIDHRDNQDDEVKDDENQTHYLLGLYIGSPIDLASVWVVGSGRVCGGIGSGKCSHI